MKTIKALTFDAERDGWEKSRGFVLRDVPMPVLDEAKNPEDAASVVIKLFYAGICGSDRGFWYRKAFKDMVHDSLRREDKSLRITGHEFVGQIVEVGSMIKALYWDEDLKSPAKIEVGSLVSGDSHVTCGKCYQCRIGQSHVCMNEVILGISADGIFAEYVKIPAKNLWPVGTDIRPEIAAIMDPFGNAVHAVMAMDMRGQRVAIFGCGPIGLFTILLAKQFGATQIIAVDIRQSNLDAAKDLGAHHTILLENKPKTNAYDPDADVVRRIMSLTDGRGADISMEMAGSPSSVNNALESTRRGGHVVLFGVSDNDLTIPKFSRYIVKGLTIHNIIGRRIFKTWQVAYSVLADRTNQVQDKIWNVILHRGKGTIVPFQSFDPERIEKLFDEYPKVIFDFQTRPKATRQGKPRK